MFCGSEKTQKKGSRKGLKRFYCGSCGKSFSVDHREKPILWVSHVDGLPFRKLADQYGLSHPEVYSRVETEMDLIIENTYLSATYCNRWSGILNLDGKYVKVKGYQKEIPFIYGMDFLTHDIPTGIMAPSESSQAFARVFRLLKTIGYPLRIVICDDSSALRLALKHSYPNAKIQLCHNHYFENLRYYLSIKTSDRFHPFFNELQAAFSTKHHPKKRQALLAHINYKYARDNDTILGIMVDIEKRSDELFAYKQFKNCPATNNMIEGYNSQLKGRFKTIKGFQSFHSAERWLNAWMIRRRTKKLTDCEKPFKHLNGECSLSQTLKKDQKWPSILGIKFDEKRTHF